MTTIGMENFKKYKKAKKIVEELNDVLKVITLTTKALSLYTKYLPVQEIISVLDNHKTILQLHRNKYNKVVANKGKE